MNEDPASFGRRRTMLSAVVLFVLSFIGFLLFLIDVTSRG